MILLFEYLENDLFSYNKNRIMFQLLIGFWPKINIEFYGREKTHMKAKVVMGYLQVVSFENE